MGRTPRAVVVAGLTVFATVAGLGAFLGFDAGPAVVAGLVTGGLAGLLIALAARRADTFHPTDEPMDDDRR